MSAINDQCAKDVARNREEYVEFMEQVQFGNTSNKIKESPSRYWASGANWTV